LRVGLNPRNWGLAELILGLAILAVFMAALI
jgi:hypothetical protein